MESAAALPTIHLVALSRTLKASPDAYSSGNYSRYYCHHRRCFAGYTHRLRHPLRAGCYSAAVAASRFGSLEESLLFSSAGRGLRGSPPVAPLGRLSLGSISSSSAYPAGAGWGGDGLRAGSDGGGGDGGSSGGGTEEKSLAGETEDAAKLGSDSDVIILDVGGMSCGGCAASVNRILESLPQVTSASVNLTTETAIVSPTPEAKATTPNWQQELGQKLANHLTTCGFKSSLRGKPTWTWAKPEEDGEPAATHPSPRQPTNGFPQKREFSKEGGSFNIHCQKKECHDITLSYHTFYNTLLEPIQSFDRMTLLEYT